MLFVPSISDLLFGKNPPPHTLCIRSRIALRERCVLLERMGKRTHLHYIFADFGDLGEELHGEYQADDAEAAGCDAAVFLFRQRRSFSFLESDLFYLFFIGVGDRRDENGWACGASRGVGGRKEGIEMYLLLSYNFINRPGPMPRMLGWVLYLWRWMR